MIAHIEGVVLTKENNALIINVGGVGVEIFATRVALDKAQVSERLSLHTRLIVREDALILFGFSSTQERDIFDILIKVSGVGPRLAIAILSTLSADNLRNAVTGERPELLTRVPGIGKKTAQKILLELKDKLPVGLDAIPQVDEPDHINSDVMDALLALGFSVIEAQTALQALPPDTPEDPQERIRLSLQYLSN